MKAIITELFATGKNGSRIIAKDGDGNRVNFKYRGDVSPVMNHYLAALKLCVKMHWGGTLHEGWLRTGVYVFVFESPATKMSWDGEQFAYVSCGLTPSVSIDILKL